MRKKNSGIRLSIRTNQTFYLLTVLYTIVLLFLGLIACFFSYQNRKSKLFSEMDMTFLQLEREYSEIRDNFWQIYMPIYESGGNDYIHSVLANYFVTSRDRAINPLEKKELSDALNQMMMRNSQIQWIVLYSEERPVNYILFRVGKSFQELRADFPYMDRLSTTSSQMEVYGMEPISDLNTTLQTYAICGGAPARMGTGRIIVGYGISAFEQICNNSDVRMPSLNYRLTSNQEILFDSGGIYEENDLPLSIAPTWKSMWTDSDSRIFFRSKISGNKDSRITCTVSWWEIFRYANLFTFPILLVVLLFAFLSIILYMIMLKMITKEVNTIRTGLNAIGENDLDYQITTDFKQSGLPEIATSINHMTVHLKENINRAYYYELRQKEAELSELQAKFNPHFLYNSLEMLRARCCQSGDEKTADLITQLAAIFRGFIGSQTFIPLRDELTFSKRYLKLFGARYGDNVSIRYDIDTELLHYGIIRNVFQPLIENYFVHGFNTSEEDNYILFRGKSLDEKTMLIAVEDNGSGMDDAEIKVLNEKLHEPIQFDTESYGLKNLHQRLLLFYGENCGLNLVRNGEKGICIQMILLKMSCEEYNKRKEGSM